MWPASRNSEAPPGAATARPAPWWLRTIAAAIDAAAGALVALALAPSAGWFFAHRAVVTLRIGEPDTLWQGPIPLLLGIFGEVVYGLPFALWVVWTLDPLAGATPGKRLCGLRVGAAGGGPAAGAARWRRSLVQTAGFWGWTLALLAGRWEIAVAATIAGAVVLFGCFAALGPASLALHDRLTATRVCRLDASAGTR